MRESIKNIGLIIALVIASVSLPTTIMSYITPNEPTTIVNNYYYNTTIVEQYNTTIVEQYNTTIIEIYNTTIIESYNTTILVPSNHTFNPIVETIEFYEFDYVKYGYNLTYNDFFWFSWNYTKLIGSYFFETRFFLVLESDLSNFETQWSLSNYDIAEDYAFYSIKSYENTQGLFRLYFNASVYMIFANTHISGYSEPKALTIAREVIYF